MTSSPFLQGKQTVPSLSSVKLHQHGTAVAGYSNQGSTLWSWEKDCCFLWNTGRMFFKCSSWWCKELSKAQELLLLFKKVCWKATITPNCIMSVPLWGFLSFTIWFSNNFHSLCTTFNCSNFWKQSLTPHTSVWAKRVQNTVLELKDIYTHIYRRARKGQSTNKSGLITSNKSELIFSPRLERLTISCINEVKHCFNIR